MIFKDLNKKVQLLTQKLVGLKKHHAIGLVIIGIGIGLVIIPFILVPFINSERIWRFPDGYSYNFLLPQNDLIQNKYKVTVFNFQLGIRFGSITLTHLETNTHYYFNYNLDWGEHTASKVLTMIPGLYSASGDFSQSSYELWEMGILPKNFDWWVYLGFSLVSIVIIFGGVKEFQGFDRDYEIEDE